MDQRDSNLAQQQQPRPSENLQFGQLMQHLHDNRQVKASSDYPLPLDASESQRVFPFQSTPSGNLKIGPNQVVFESKKVSVLVASPRHALVNVKAEQRLPPGTTFSALERLQTQRKLPAELAPAADGPQRPRTQPQPRPKEAGRMAQPKTKAPAQPRGEEVALASLGFTGEQAIDWQSIRLPDKTDLYLELASRITAYKNADCIVRIGNDEFHCHLLVLQSYSSFFDEKNIKEIELSGSSVTSTAFSIIYDWMISPTSESCHLLRRDNILEVFRAAQHLGIKELEEQCWAFIDNDELFSEDTAFLLYLEARKVGNTAVMELMVPRIMKFFLMLVSTRDFLHLSVEELCLLLRSNYICVNSEMEVLMSAVRWLMHEWEGRKQYLLEVMKCVRFGLIAPWQLVDVKRNPENPEFMELMSYPEIQKMVDDGLAFVIIKYWYGNQTEDYYHWIDLLGLAEPTNRNWAGEDKHYVTYRDFLLYLEEYQKTKLSELKDKKTHVKTSPPSPPPKEDCPPHAAAANRHRVNHQNPKAAEMASLAKISRPSKNSTEASASNGPPCMMMPPEILQQYLESMGRNNGKLASSREVGKGSQPTLNTIYTRRACAHPINEASSSSSSITSSRLLTAEKNIYEPADIKQQRPSGYSRCADGGKQALGISHLKQYSALSNLPKKFTSAKCVEEKRRVSESPKSAGEVTSDIQAVLRAYKQTTKTAQMKERRSESKATTTKRIADLIRIPAVLNSHKPSELRMKFASCPGFAGGERERAPDKETAFDETIAGSFLTKHRDKPLDDQIVERESAGNDNSIFTSHLTAQDESSLRKRDSVDGTNERQREPRYKSRGGTRTRKRTKTKLPQQMSKFERREEVALVFGGIDPHCKQQQQLPRQGAHVLGYDHRNGWRSVGEMPQPRQHHCVAWANGRVYLAGGSEPRQDATVGSVALATVWSYDPRAGSWRSEASMLTRRQNFGLVTIDAQIFAIGGQSSDGTALRTVEAFDLSAREWTERRSMRLARVGPAAAGYESRIWVAGGMTNCSREPITDDVECYDSVANVWHRMEPLLSPRCFSCFHVVEGRLLIVGGASETRDRSSIESIDCVDVWHPGRRGWQPQARLRTARHGHATTSIGDRLLVLGGVTTTRARSLRSVECYSFARADWQKCVPPLPLPISGLSALSLLQPASPPARSNAQ